MTSLASIKKQIAALEAEAARITKAETAAAIAKIKELMSSFGLTAEHLGTAMLRGKRAVPQKSTPKRAGSGAAKYADPKTGKTWSGFGRAPMWIASAKNRDAFLADKNSAEVVTAAAKAPVASKKAAAKAAKPAKPAKKPASAKTTRSAKNAAAVATAPVVATKKPSAAKKAAAPKTAINKAASKKRAPKAAAQKSASKKKASVGTAAPQAAAAPAASAA
ncbi:MAG: H-NS histone family protein [Burkholderiaceae bacterium]